VFRTSPRRGLDADLWVVKDWHVQARDCAAALAGMVGVGGTPLSASILKGADMLAGVAAATRRIMMVVTDGDCDFGPEAVTKACTLAADDGVEVVGIGMDCDSVTQAFPPRYSVNVKDLRQLAEAGLGVLVAMLEDASPHAAD